MRVAWAFMQRSIIPVINALANLWIATLKLEIAAISSAFQNVLLPALRIIWSFIQTFVIPAFQRFDAAVGGIANRIADAVNWINTLANSVSNLADRLGGGFNFGFGGNSAGVRGFDGFSAQTAGGPPIVINQSFGSMGSGNFDVGRQARDGVFDALRRRGR
jgi:hypothetical protein